MLRNYGVQVLFCIPVLHSIITIRRQIQAEVPYIVPIAALDTPPPRPRGERVVLGVVFEWKSELRETTITFFLSKQNWNSVEKLVS